MTFASLQCHPFSPIAENEKQTQEGLMAEIQTLSKSWSELEEQNTRKILNLSKIEDYKLHYKEEVRLCHVSVSIGKLSTHIRLT